MHACMHVQTYMHAGIYMRAYMACTHAYIHTYIQTNHLLPPQVTDPVDIFEIAIRSQHPFGKDSRVRTACCSCVRA